MAVHPDPAGGQWEELPRTIRTARLVLRPWTLDDAADVLAYAADPAWARFVPVPQPYQRVHAEQFVARQVSSDWRTDPTWAIEVHGRASGGVDMAIAQEHRRAVLGYGLARRCWGRGYMTEAVRAVIDAAFASAPALVRVASSAIAGNRASTRVMEKAGMTYEGTRRQYVVHRGCSVDMRSYAVLRSEWEQSRRR